MDTNINDSIRSVSPRETLQRLQKIFDKIGITRVTNITHLDQFYGIYISNCIRPNSQNLSVSQGKGSSLESSQISAIMESIEAYHVENFSKTSFRGTFENCNNSNFIEPELLYLSGFKTDIKKVTFDWLRVKNILDQKTYFIPSAFARINTCFPNLDYLYFNVSSNGLAAGNTKNEALNHAICEIIERDSLAKWQTQDKLLRDSVSVLPTTIYDFNREFIDNLNQHNLEVKIWDITSNLGIPTYQVAIMDNHNIRDLNVFTGTGAHLSKSIALFRAISEAIQGRLTYISGIRDDVFENYYKKMRLSSKKFTSSYESNKGKNYLDCISIKTENVDANLKILLNILLKNNYQQILVFEHTKPELEIPVVQVFIPGMKLHNSRM